MCGGGGEGGVHELAHFPTILIYTRDTDGEENYHFFLFTHHQFIHYSTHHTTA